MPIGFDRPTGNGLAGRSPIIAHQGMAATSQPLATQIAIDLLKAGGTAVDAAIGANAALGVMEPTGCGIGGDLFAMVWDAEEKRLYGLNASGAAPLKQTRAELKRKVERIPTPRATFRQHARMRRRLGRPARTAWPSAAR
jgi:gamma-glutamyltranspeptidase/glutathione hydrolase